MKESDVSGPCILSLILKVLDVPYTDAYARQAFESMTFRSLFGLRNALKSYGVDAHGWELKDSEEALALPVPFLASQGADFVLVTDVTDTGVTIRRNGENEPKQLTRHEFGRRYRGTVMVFGVADGAAEPKYRQHRLEMLADKAKGPVLAAMAAVIVIYCFAAHDALHSFSPAAVALCYAAGIYVSYLLMLKTHGISSAAGDSLCSVIERTGCHTVLSTKAARFFGIVSWSEVGMAYFSVSLGVLLCAPEYAPWLAVADACCCPFSFWSVWYQKYRAKAWCTMCLTVQALLWIILAIYLIGGWFGRIYWPAPGIFAILAAYVAAVLMLNAAGNIFDKFKRPES